MPFFMPRIWNKHSWLTLHEQLRYAYWRMPVAPSPGQIYGTVPKFHDSLWINKMIHTCDE